MEYQEYLKAHIRALIDETTDTDLLDLIFRLLLHES